MRASSLAARARATSAFAVSWIACAFGAAASRAQELAPTATRTTARSIGVQATAATGTDPVDVSARTSAKSSASASTSAALGGDASVRDATSNAFGFPAPALSAEEKRRFSIGNSFFRQNWVSAPASASGRDGLGPFFNARSCSACHLHDGRGRPPQPGEDSSSGLLLRLGVAGASGDLPHPAYGEQLQDGAIESVVAEARWRVEWTRIEHAWSDGTPYELVAPRYAIDALAYGELGAETRIGARVAPQLIGLGLLEAIPEPALLAREDPGDRDGDGISGRAHRLAAASDGVRRIGRFGWKATQSLVREQVAAAFANDMGLTTSLRPTERVTELEARSVRYVSGGDPEVDDLKLERVAFYSQVLAVPEQRDVDLPLVRRGAERFGTCGCRGCHVETWTTGAHPLAVLAHQRIHPYTDLLLHDMGEQLADAKRDGDAQPGEWRTPPLWGIGLFEAVNGHTRYLHDGRARSLAEAVLWHGGEATAARERFVALSAEQRDELLAFLASL